MSFLSPFGLWGYLAIFLAGAAASGSATYYVVHNANAVEILAQKDAADADKAARSEASLNQLKAFIGNMQAASNQFNAAVGDIDARFGAIEKGFHFAKPLPVNCRPDDDRVRKFNAAIAAANAHTAP